MKADKQQRVEHANELIKVISDHGRRFFYNAKHNRVAHLEVDKRGRVWFVDDYSGKRIYTQRTTFGNGWRGFTHGGTLRNLIEWLCDYILTGDRVPRRLIAPAYLYSSGDIWGYGDEQAKAVRQAAYALPIMEPEEQAEVTNA